MNAGGATQEIMEKHSYFLLVQNHHLGEEEVTEKSPRAAGKQNKKNPKNSFILFILIIHQQSTAAWANPLHPKLCCCFSTEKHSRITADPGGSS